jgi:hypothetical protein
MGRCVGRMGEKPHYKCLMSVLIAQSKAGDFYVSGRLKINLNKNYKRG